MASGGGGGRSGSRSGGFRSSRFRSGFPGTSSKSPSLPDEVVVRYSKGGPVRVVRPSDVEGATFESNLFSEFDKYGTPAGPIDADDEEFDPCNCKEWLKAAIEATLFEGSESDMSEACRDFLKDYCGVEVDIGASKNGSTCTGSVQN